MYKAPYTLSQSAIKSLQDLGFEGKNGIQVFDTFGQGFVIGLGMSKDEAIEKGILEKQEPNPLHKLTECNEYIPHTWIEKHLTEEQYSDFTNWMEGQTQSEYGVYNNDLQRFLKFKGI